MVAMVSWPTVINDDGSLTVGTPWAKAISDAIKASIEDQVHSAVNPTLKPHQITDEVRTARGSLGSLAAWGLVEHLADGTHSPSSNYVTVAQAGDSVLKNLDTDSMLNNWPDGDTAAPAGRTIEGGGATITRAVSLGWGGHGVMVESAGSRSAVRKTVLAAADYQSGYGGKKITIACLCRAFVANQASIVFDDGAIQTRGGSSGPTSPRFHTGDGTVKWIWTTAQIDGAATKLEYYVESVQAGTQPRFSSFMVVLGEIVPTVYFPERMGEFYMGIQIHGDLIVADGQNNWVGRVPRNCVFMGLAGSVKTAPTNADAIEFTAEKSTDLSAWVDIYATSPSIAVGAKEVDSGARTKPDGSFANRCFKEGDYIRLNIDQVGNILPGADFCGDLMFSVPMPELDVYKV